MNLSSEFRVARLFSNRHLALSLLHALLATAFFAANASAQTPLTISGTPDATVEAGKDYLFQPTSTGASVFSIVNKPSWATFSTTTGRLSGKPTFATTHSNVIILARDSAGVAVSLPGFSIVVTAVPLPLTISGTPDTTVAAGTAYGFMPTATGASKFAILNKPSWAAFSTTTGLLSGTPTAAATHSNIVILASNSSGFAVSLPAFSIVVNQGSVRTATLSWTRPTQNTDGTALTDLSGYRIYCGTSPNALNQTLQLDATVTTYVFENLSPAAYYCAVKAYNSTNVESDLSNVVNKTIL
jgi:hypothetical protein